MRQIQLGDGGLDVSRCEGKPRGGAVKHRTPVTLAGRGGVDRGALEPAGEKNKLHCSHEEGPEWHCHHNQPGSLDRSSNES